MPSSRPLRNISVSVLCLANGNAMRYHAHMKKLSPHTRTRLIWRNGKKVRAHRWIMEQRIGRKLQPFEHVHHINGNPLDNNIENLVVLSANAHMRLHKQIYPDQKHCVRCGAVFTVNNRKRKRNKTCSQKCAQAMRVDGIKSSRRSRKHSAE
jgi:HNH endonuclease